MRTTKRALACGLLAAILVTAVSCDNNPDFGDSVYDFQDFLAGLPVGSISGARWPVQSTGNTLSVVEEPGGGRALRVSFGGAHGVDVLLTGDNGVGVGQGYALEIRGRIVVIATGEAPATSSFPGMWPFQLAAIRSAFGEDPSTNLVQVSVRPPSPEFVIRRVIRSRDLAAPVGGRAPGPTLRLVNEPSNFLTAMYVTDILVLPPR
ncbi:MAG: hypothetical protein FWB79_01760 [Treponema sp.]|nr:hypothetical protein [Treponema sp.]